MAFKKVTELQLLWSIETVLSVFDYLIASIFRAELNALLLAIDVVTCSKENSIVIFSDSMSSLQSINGFNLDSDPDPEVRGYGTADIREFLRIQIDTDVIFKRLTLL